MHRNFALLLAASALSLMGCDFNDPNWAHYGNCESIGGSTMTRIVDDPENCGNCGNHCLGGVPCANYTCQMNSVLHCGEANRQCVAVDSEDVACVRFDEVLGDAGAPPEGVELVNGYGCVPSGGPGPAEASPDDADPAGQSKRLDPSWVLIPGHTPACADGFETNGCVTGEVTLTDVCGASITEPLAYDFAIMTEEVSRGLYRDTLCDCTAPRFIHCRALCAERDAPDAEALEERPMTGLNWCEAYAACQALDARLPTVRERARLEAMVGGPTGLFDEALSCGAWAEATGEVPWLVECLEAAPGEVTFDAVKGEAGRVYIGEGILTTPEAVCHLLGNANEWAADPAASLATTRSSEETSFWGVPRNEAEARQPRLLRGRSLFSPAGEPSDRLLAVDPNLRADDVGLRCARTTRSPYAEPVPYDATLLARNYALCDGEHVALRPVRRTVGEQVYRATSVCLDAEAPPAVRARVEGLGRGLLLDDDGPSAFARRVNAGVLQSVGIARFAGDEQWWWSEPVAETGQKLAFSPSDRWPLWMTWHGESQPEQSRCREGSGSSRSDGKVVTRHAFTLEYNQSTELGVDGAAIACAHLDCVDPTISGEACPVDCPGWILPFAVEFERVEPYSSRQLCP